MKINSTLIAIALCASAFPSPSLKERYLKEANRLSDIQDHIPTLYEYAKQCNSIVEIGIRGVVSTWSMLYGLSENGSSIKEYTGIDIDFPEATNFSLALKLARKHKIKFRFIHKDDMTIDIPDTDFLFIDSLHTYCHLTYELETFSKHARKYIGLHDTSPPWGYQDESTYSGDYSEYPSWIDRSKRGLWAAVEDFLEKHPEWTVELRKSTSSGLTILKRVEQ